jgi:hypothetical protein
MVVSFIGGGNRRTPLTTGGELMLHMLHPSCYSLTTRASSDMEIKNLSGMNPGMRNLKYTHVVIEKKSNSYLDSSEDNRLLSTR